VITATEIVVKVAEALDQCGVPYLLAGAYSSNQYGIPRSTKDADFVLQLKAALGTDFTKALGQGFEIDPQLSFETNTGTYRQVLRYPGSPFTVELFQLSNDPHDQERFRRRRAAQLFGRTLWFPSPEDVIVMKLRWARGRDKDDIRSIVSVQQDKLDWPYIENWCRQHGTLALLKEIQRTVPGV
jgi:hypothetical protein